MGGPNGRRSRTASAHLSPLALTRNPAATHHPRRSYLDDLWIYTLDPRGPASLYGTRNTGMGTTLFEGALPVDVQTGVWNSTKPKDRMSGNEATNTRDLLFGDPVSAGLGAWQQVLPREACFSWVPCLRVRFCLTPEVARD